MYDLGHRFEASPQAEWQSPRYELLPFKGAKTEAQWANLPLGATATMTCSAKLGQSRTIERAVYLQNQRTDLTVVPHLAARAIASQAELDEYLAVLADNGINSAFVVGGDVADTPDRRFHDSLSLLQAIRDRQGPDELELGCTAYPDGHAFIDRTKLQEDLLSKQDMVGYCATQLCFSPCKISRWARDMQTAGLELPVKVGIPGMVDTKKLLRIVKEIGISDSTSYLRKNFSLGWQSLTGGLKPDKLVRALTPELTDPDSLIAGFHVNTFNAIDQTEAWRQAVLGTLIGQVVDAPALPVEAEPGEQIA